MANNVVSISSKVPAKLAQRLGGLTANDDLSSGLTGGFGVLSIRGGKWRIKAGGEETPITDKEGDPVAAVRLLIIKANPSISKNFYLKRYEEGANEAPDCFSMDGVAPDPTSPKIQSKTCAACPKNVFGSRITDQGKKAKACGDHRRLAVVPEGDLANEQFGGPMLLRVPATALVDLANYGKATKAKGFPYNTIITRVGFDMDVSYPKPTFRAARPLTEDEEEQVLALLDDPIFAEKIELVMAKPLEHADSEQPEDTTVTKIGKAKTPVSEEEQSDLFDNGEEEDTLFADEEETPAPAKKKAIAKKAPAKKAAAKKAAAKKPAPVEEEEESDDLDDELDDILNSLDNLD